MKDSRFFLMMVGLTLCTTSNSMFYLVNNNEQHTQQIDVQIKLTCPDACRLSYSDQKKDTCESNKGFEFVGYLNPRTSLEIRHDKNVVGGEGFPELGCINRLEIKINDRFYVIKNISGMCALEWRDDDLAVIHPAFGNINPKEIIEVR